MSKYKLIIVIIILAIAGYFLSANLNDHSTKKLTTGEKLVVTDTCKPLENKCEILGVDLKLNIQFKAQASYQRLLEITLNSSVNPLDEVSISLLIDGQEMPMEAMKSVGDKQHWEAQLMPFADVTKDNLQVRLRVLFNRKFYYSKVAVEY